MNNIIPSDEQKKIISAISSNENVLADCVAGSGKTTTALLIADAFPNKKILLTTFSSRLKTDGREKAKALNLKNITVHSYHSLCRKYYITSHTDQEIIKVVKQSYSTKERIENYDLIILDETQDMKYLYFYFIRKFIYDCKTISQMVILGDKNQTIFKFLGSDPRFLTLSNEIWNKNFTKLNLDISYRVKSSNAFFINEVMLGVDRIKPHKEGLPVAYSVCDSYKIGPFLADYIQSEIAKRSIRPDDVFILASSLKSSENDKYDKPIKSFERHLVFRNLPVFYPSSEDQELSDETCVNKIVFSTFHQSKGRERKLVIIFGFDESYFKYFAKTDDPKICPELLYVACTRAKDQLILLHDAKNRPLPFLKMGIGKLKEQPYINFQGFEECTFIDKKVEDKKPPPVSVTDLVKFLKPHNRERLQDIVDNIMILETEPYIEINIPSIVNTEEVADINGVSIAAMYEANDKISTVEKYVRTNSEAYFDFHISLKYHFTSLPSEIKTIEDFIKLTIIYITSTDNIHNRLKQIIKYDWLSPKVVKSCHEIMAKHIGKDAMYEKELRCVYELRHDIGKIVVVGRLDVEDERYVIELKCTSQLTLEHKLQLIVYCWLLNHLEPGFRKGFKLLNIRTGEVWILNENYKIETIDMILDILIDNKYGLDKVITDQNFIDDCSKFSTGG